MQEAKQEEEEGQHQTPLLTKCQELPYLRCLVLSQEVALGGGI